MNLRAGIVLVSLLFAVSGSVYGEPPITQLQPGMRAITLKVHDQFAERPGTLVDIYVSAPTTSRRSRTAIAFEKGVFSNVESVVEPETVLLTKVPVLSASDVPQGYAVVGVSEADATKIHKLREKYGDKLRVRLAK